MSTYPGHRRCLYKLCSTAPDLGNQAIEAACELADLQGGYQESMFSENISQLVTVVNTHDAFHNDSVVWCSDYKPAVRT